MTGVLVALQQTGEDRPLPPAAEHLVALLRSWGPGPEHLTGLALAGITLPSRLGPRSVDALVFTRFGVVVIAAHEPGPTDWPGPGDRTGAAVAAARGALAGHEGGRHVTGLVAVVPPAGSRGSGTAAGEQDLRSGGPVPQTGVPEPARQVREAERPDGAGHDRPPTEAIPVQRPFRGDSAEAASGQEPLRSDAPQAALAEHPLRSDAPEVGPGRQPSGSDSPEVSPAHQQSRSDLLEAASVQEPLRSESPEAASVQQAPRSDPPALHWPEPVAVPGVAVVLADPRGLRRIIAQHNRWRTVWSADDVLDACYALSLAHLAPPRAALIDDGFPARLPVLSRLPELPAVVPVPPEPPPATEDDPAPRVPPARGPVSAVFPRQRPIRQVPWGLLFVLTVLVAVGVVAAVFVAQVFHGS